MAANPAMVIRVAANLAELKKNLAEGKNQIETTTAAMAKIATSLQGDKLIQQAHNVVAAVHSIGGASRLTVAEQERVNDVVSRALEKYAALGRDAPPALHALKAATEQVEAPTSRVESLLGGVVGEVGKMAAGFLTAQAVIGGVQSGFRALTAFVSDSVTAYIEADAAQSKLTGALRAQSMAVPSVVSHYRELASEFQRTTAFEDDLITSTQAMLVQIGGVMPSQMQGALTATTDLAAGLGIDLEQATMLVARAAAGHTEALGRYGITVSESALKSEGFGAVLGAVNEKFGGQAQQQVDTYAARLAQMTNTWGDVKEAVGKFLVTNELVTFAFNALAKAVSHTDEVSGKSLVSITALYALLTRDPVGARALSMLEEYVGYLNDIQAAADRMKALKNPFQLPDDPMVGIMARANAEFEKWRKELDAGRKAAKEAAEEQKRWNETVREATERTGLSTFNLHRFAQVVVPEATSRAAEFREELENWIPPLESKAIQGFPDRIARMNVEASKTPAFFEAAAAATVSWGSRIKSAFGDALGDLNNVFMRAFEGGGGVGGAVQSLATSLGANLLNMIPVVGPIISKFSGAIVGGFKKLFGFGDSEKQKVDEVRQAFIDQIGGWHELNKAAQGAGVTLDKVLNARKVKDYEAAIKELNDAIDFQKQAMATLDETVKKYGFTIEELGPKFAAQELDQKAQELFKDYQVLTAAGIDVDTVLARMGGSVNDFVQKSLAMGIEVPSAMRPMIERMIELGLLTDANGEVISSLEDAGINFALTMSEGFHTLIDEVKRLTDAIARGLGLALDTVADQVTNFPDLNADVQFNIPDMPVYPMAAGAVGRVDRPTLFLAGEAGPEDFAFSGAHRSFGGGGGSQVQIVVNAQGAFFDTPASRQRLAKMVSESVMEELRRRTRLNAA